MESRRVLRFLFSHSRDTGETVFFVASANVRENDSGLRLIDRFARLPFLRMSIAPLFRRALQGVVLAVSFSSLLVTTVLADSSGMNGRYLYVAAPGLRDYLQYGGHGVLVFDIDHGHRFVRRIASSGVTESGKPINVKGICASAVTHRLYVSNIKTLICFDLLTDKILWEKTYEGGCDRLEITPDGKTLYAPSFEGAFWNVIDAIDGHSIAQITTDSGAHNTIVSRDGKFAYLAGLKSPVLSVASTSSHQVVKTVGPFSAEIRPFTINADQSRVYVNVNRLLGFEVGDLRTGKVLQRVEVTGFSQGEVKRHGCPSHGIALTRDGKQLWLADAHNHRLHLFDLTANPIKQIESIEVRDDPGWITFSLDGSLVYPSTGDVIDGRTHRVVATLTDETGAAVQSEKLLEIDFANGKPIRAGSQFAVGEQ